MPHLSPVLKRLLVEGFVAEAALKSAATAAHAPSFVLAVYAPHRSSPPRLQPCNPAATTHSRWLRKSSLESRDESSRCRRSQRRAACSSLPPAALDADTHIGSSPPLGTPDMARLLCARPATRLACVTHCPQARCLPQRFRTERSPPLERARLEPCAARCACGAAARVGGPSCLMAVSWMWRGPRRARGYISMLVIPRALPFRPIV